MRMIQLTDGQEFRINFVGVYNDLLQIGFPPGEVTFFDIVDRFTDVTLTEIITGNYDYEQTPTEYTGFTELIDVRRELDNSFIITLKRGKE